MALTAVLALAAAGACFLLVKLTGPLPGELRFESWRLDGYPATLDRPLNFITYLGDTWIAAAVVVIFAAVTAEEAGPRWAVLVVAAAGSAIFAELLSDLLGSTASEYGGAAGVNFGRENNFPSGHTAFVTSVYSLTSWMAWERGHRALAASLALAVVLIGPSLAMLGNHYPADIVAGYLVGLAWLMGVLLVGERWAGGGDPQPDLSAPSPGESSRSDRRDRLSRRA